MALSEENVMSEYDNLSVEGLKLWSVDSLKAFLQARNKKVDGLHEELVARAYVAWEEKVLVDSTYEHCLRQNTEDYKHKLMTAFGVVPDPFSLKNGWVSAKDGAVWPSVYLSDISVYLQHKSTDIFHQKMLQEYKQGKGYRYFSAGHVGDINMHNISEKIPVAFLSSKVKPSMKAIPDYQVWALLKKDTKAEPGGSIYSAYCTCPAGLHGTCNHIIGLLFKMENAVMCGSKSCTSKLCQWNMPRRCDLEGVSKRLNDHVWKKDRYMKTGSGTYKRQASVLKLGTAYDPATGSKQKKEDHVVCNDLAEILRTECPTSSYMQLHDMKPFPKKEVPGVVRSVLDRASEIDKTLNEDEQQLLLSKAVMLTAGEVHQLEVATRDQANSIEWKKQRCGRITASNSKRVYTRSKTLKEHPEADPSALVKVLMGYETKRVNTYATKHGTSMEPHAKLQYSSIALKKHKNCKTSETGLHIHPEYGYLAATPDLKVSCDCHSKYIVEIKCPWMCRDEAPTPDNWSHLKHGPNGPHLCQKSLYYFQIQTQLAVTGCEFCDFFVYTTHGHHLERIEFNAIFWNDLFSYLELFWLNYLRPELLSHSLEEGNVQQLAPGSQDHIYHSTGNNPTTSADHSRPERSATTKTHLTKPQYALVFLCCICNESCVNDATTVGEQSIECASCSMWCHFVCAGIDEDCLPAKQSTWYCNVCS